jgi:sialic acid synthase SpsE
VLTGAKYPLTFCKLLNRQEKNMTELIAEIGINHLGDVIKLKRVIEKAAKARLKSVKFQYRSRSDDFFHSALEMGSTLVSQELETTNMAQSHIVDACKQARSLGMAAGVSFFRIADLHAFCADLVPDYIKIPSAEALNIELITAAQSYGVPIIVSTGGLTWPQLQELAEKAHFKPKDCVMYCVANYPAALGATLPSMIKEYRGLFGCRIGYSSHDRDWELNIAFINADVEVIERHLCESKDDVGLDISTSSDLEEMERLNMFCANDAWRKPANIKQKVPNQGEIQNLKDLGSGYYYDRGYHAGSKVSLAELVIKSPCRGVRAGSINDFTVLHNVTTGEPVVYEDLRKGHETIALDFDQLKTKRISLPVRFHDYQKIIDKFSLKNFEFHMSYKDVSRIGALKDELRSILSSDMEFSIHLPDYISSSSLINPFSSDAGVKRDSLSIIDDCVGLADFFEDFTSKKCPIVGSFSVNEEKSKLDFYSAYRDFFGEILEQKGASIVPQYLPKKAWYFGGSCTLEVFCSLSDLEYYQQMPNGICLDTAHCIMAANYEGASTSEWLNALLPLATHVHISDALGDDGEGVTFGEGDLGDDIYNVLAHDSVKVVEQWEGHLYNFSGFERALKYLEEYL